MGERDGRGDETGEKRREMGEIGRVRDKREEEKGVRSETREWERISVRARM